MTAASTCSEIKEGDRILRTCSEPGPFSSGREGEGDGTGAADSEDDDEVEKEEEEEGIVAEMRQEEEEEVDDDNDDEDDDLTSAGPSQPGKERPKSWNIGCFVPSFVNASVTNPISGLCGDLYALPPVAAASN